MRRFFLRLNRPNRLLLVSAVLLLVFILFEQAIYRSFP